MKFCFIFGTRPEVIKLAPIIKIVSGNPEDEFVIIQTGQHFSFNMFDSFMRELEVPRGKMIYNLDVNRCLHGKMVGKMMSKIEDILLRERPDCVIVQGDTDSALAGALVAAKLHFPLVHIEAGLRSFDKRMPEEYNRIIIDHISDIHFPPTDIQDFNLKTEGIYPKRSIRCVLGNTISDAIKDILPQLPKVEAKNYAFVTIHREENVNDPFVFRTIISTLAKLPKEFCLNLVFPMHPRTATMMERLRIALPFKTYEPMDYKTSIAHIKNAKIVITDSGGLIEEAFILGVPSVQVRLTSDRPEAEIAGASVLIGGGLIGGSLEDWRGPALSLKIEAAIVKALKLKVPIHPYGDNVSCKMYEMIKDKVNKT
jgi:UDP-N-acetylglucosamine 2-epimerase (non-hydrolysing)